MKPIGNLRIPPLPANVADFERKVKSERTLNDYVEDIHRALYDESEEYRTFLDAVWDEDAVEGSLRADNLEAANLIREYARERNIAEVKDKKKETIVKSLNVVLRRYVGQSRKDRRNMVGGTIVPGNGDGVAE